MHIGKKARAQSWGSPGTICLFHFEAWSLIGLELEKLSKLSGLWTPIIHLSSSSGIVRIYHTWLDFTFYFYFWNGVLLCSLDSVYLDQAGLRFRDVPAFCHLGAYIKGVHYHAQLFFILCVGVSTWICTCVYLVSQRSEECLGFPRTGFIWLEHLSW